MAFRSVYWEKGSDKDSVLRQSGLKTSHVWPRVGTWRVKASIALAQGQICIGSTKALQLMGRRKAEMIEKGGCEPRSYLVVPYLNDQQLGAKFEPLYMVNPAWITQREARSRRTAASSIPRFSLICSS